MGELLTRFDLELVALTRGAEGANLDSNNETVGQPGIPTTVNGRVPFLTRHRIILDRSSQIK